VGSKNPVACQLKPPLDEIVKASSMRPHASSETLLESWWISFVFLFFLSERGMCGAMIRIHFDSTLIAKFRSRGFLRAFPRALRDSLAEIELLDRVDGIACYHSLMFQNSSRRWVRQKRTEVSRISLKSRVVRRMRATSFFLTRNFRKFLPCWSRLFSPRASRTLHSRPVFLEIWSMMPRHRANDTGPATNFPLHRFWSVVYRSRGGSYFFIWTRSKYASKGPPDVRFPLMKILTVTDFDEYNFLTCLRVFSCVLCIGDLCSASVLACSLALIIDISI